MIGNDIDLSTVMLMLAIMLRRSAKNMGWKEEQVELVVVLVQIPMFLLVWPPLVLTGQRHILLCLVLFYLFCPPPPGGLVGDGYVE